jgi:hypothetical protein
LQRASRLPHLRDLRELSICRAGNALPQIGASFGLSKAALGDFTQRHALSAPCPPSLIPLADRLGRRRILLVP